VERAENNMKRKITVLTLWAVLFALCGSVDAEQKNERVPEPAVELIRLPFFASARASLRVQVGDYGPQIAGKGVGGNSPGNAAGRLSPISSTLTVLPFSSSINTRPAELPCASKQ
jgi:hypothetical protein